MDLRVVLLGRVGAGKSATGNIILGCRQFHVESSTVAVTKNCSLITGSVDGDEVTVVDTPGWNLADDTAIQQAVKSITMLPNGLHVFLLVVPIGRFTNEEATVVKNIQEVLGEAATKLTMVLFTRGDDLEGKPIGDYVKNAHGDLKELTEKYGGRYHVLDNKDRKNRKQVSELLLKIKEVVEHNLGGTYTDEMFQMQQRKMVERRVPCVQISQSAVEVEGEEPDESVVASKNDCAHSKVKTVKERDEREDESGKQESGEDQKLEDKEFYWTCEMEALREDSRQKEYDWREREHKLKKHIHDLESQLSERDIKNRRLEQELELQKTMIEGDQDRRREQAKQKREMEHAGSMMDARGETDLIGPQNRKHDGRKRRN